MTVNKEVNAGVHANVGMDFQKNCALFLLLEKYPSLTDSRYFIILEHYDDIVFGYLDETGQIDRIETFQSKKSSNEWKISHLYEILKKIISNGLSIRNDEIEKTDKYSQLQYFVTNQTISLKITEKKLNYIHLVNDSDSVVTFPSLPKQIKDDFINKLKDEHSCSELEIKELENLTLRYIDLSRKSSSQKEQLIGMFQTVFGDKIIDHKAALDTLFYIFHNSETTLNQKHVAKLSDKTKRIESEQINSIIEILTTKKKAYDVWRKKSDVISISMSIPIFEQNSFKLHFENSFDKFKDLKEIEHQKIYNYVKSKKVQLSSFYTDSDCLGFLVTNFSIGNNTQLTDIQLKASIFAAFIEIKDIE